MPGLVTKHGLILLLVVQLLSACGEDLGTCDPVAARQLVYGKNGLVATKGQALLHDSCGSAAFCHAANAKGDDRYGAPYGLNFDTLPLPTHWPEVVEHRKEIWGSVLDGSMPPEGVGQRALGNNDWSFDPERLPSSPRLARLTKKDSKAALRNWLACDAPVVTETEIPIWAQPATDGGSLSDWGPIFTQVMVPKCATAGCHNGSAAGGLVLLDECEAYEQLFAESMCGGKPRLQPGDGESYLLDKLEAKKPKCGSAMPPAGALRDSELRAIRAWVEGGAPAASCN